MATLFQQFVNVLPVKKTVTVIVCCPKCHTEVYRSDTAVNGLNEWAYKGCRDGDEKYELGAGHQCTNKCFAPKVVL